MASLYRIQTELTGLPGGPGVATFHFLAASGSGQAAQDAVDLFWAGCQSAMSTGVTATPTNLLVTFEDTTGTATSFTTVTGVGITGTSAGDRLSGSLNGLVRWTTPAVVNGRRLQGRTFVPGPIEAQSDSTGRPLATYRTDVDAAADALLGSALSDLVVWHRPNALGPGSNAIVDGATVWSEWAVLRGRRD